MRNLKRVLALALALVMVIGMMVIGSSAASYSDAAAIDEDYAVAVEVLSGMGIFKGQGAGFAPKATLTRAEAAALIYRVITADVKDAKVSLYDYSSFADVAEGNWATGYITYAANGGYVKGDGTGNFLPNAQVTGVQVLAIMLRAAGYGQKGEFEGAAWKDNVLTTAHDLGLLKNIKANDLDKPATRELVAQIIWDALWAPTTTYTPAFGYWASAVTLGDKFALAKTDGFEYDVFMRPSYGYTYNTGDFATMWNVEPVAEFTTKVTDCALTSAVGAKTNWTADIYTNGALTYNDHTIVATATTATVEGTAQGTLTQVFNLGTAKKPVWHITEIETWLAKVADVKAATYDAAGHEKTPAETKFTVYYPTGATTTWTLETTEYAKNSYVLLTYSEKDGDTKTTGVQPIAIVDVTPVTPAATAKATYWLNDTTIVGGVAYNNACKFDLGKGTLNAVKTYDVYVDLYGNIIGLVEYVAPNTYAYGVITAIKWVDTNDLLNDGYVLSNIVKVDATTMANTILKDNTLTAADGFTSGGTASNYNADLVAETTQNNEGQYDGWMFEYTLNPDGSYNITRKASAVAAAQSIKAGVANLFVGTDGNYMATNDNTVYLVKTMSAGQAVYTSYVGYKNVPSMNNVSVQFMKAATTVSGVYSDYVYVDAAAATYDGQAGYVWFTKDLEAADAIGYNATGDKAYVAYIDGVATIVYLDKATEAATLTSINGWDLYVVTRNADGDITSATRWTPGAVIADVTGITGTVITNGQVDGTFNCTGATVYAYAADGSSVTVVPEANWAATVVGKTAYVKDLTNDGMLDIIYVQAGAANP